MGPDKEGPWVERRKRVPKPMTTFGTMMWLTTWSSLGSTWCPRDRTFKLKTHDPELLPFAREEEQGAEGGWGVQSQ